MRKLDLYPLDAPGMPEVGPNVLQHVTCLPARGELTTEDGAKADPEVVAARLRQFYEYALTDHHCTMSVTLRNAQLSVQFVPGHIWGQGLSEFVTDLETSPPGDGPRPADVMLIGKLPGKNEAVHGRCLIGESGRILVEALQGQHIRGSLEWYITNLVKFPKPEMAANISKDWIRDCLPLLHQELRLVRPKFILCLGADASTALLGKKFNVSNMDGRVEEYAIPLHKSAAETPNIHTALVMTVVHPAQVARAPEMRRTLERGLGKFDQLCHGIRFDRIETDLDHRAIRTYEGLEELLEEIANDPDKHDDWIGLDAEWQGEHPQNNGAYVRMIQIAWRPKHAAAIVLRAAGGEVSFVDRYGDDATDRAVALLDDFLAARRVAGHFIVADMEHLEAMGFRKFIKAFLPPLDDELFEELSDAEQAVLAKVGFGIGSIVPAYELTRVRGGWDTALAAHAVEETAQLGLEVLLTRYTECPRYDIPLDKWKDEVCKTKKIKRKDLGGYGECPDDTLIPYGCYDADGTLRLMYVQQPLVDSDYEGHNCREPFWESMLTVGPILEMHHNGVLVDRKRIDELTQVFVTARKRLELELRTFAKWPEFNPRSLQHVREFLFGEQLNGRLTETNEPDRIRPAHALTLGLIPVVDTSRRPRLWSFIVEKGLEKVATPGTGHTAMGVLLQDNPQQLAPLMSLRDWRYVDQALKSVLREPEMLKSGEYAKLDYDDFSGDTDGDAAGLVYDSGLATQICLDGRVRTHFYPTAETGRWRSSRPNLQNISKRRDDDYERVLGPNNYKHKMRSVIRATPGHVLIEADYKAAEVFVAAISSGDEALIAHCLRAQLPEDDPNFYDIHANVAVLAFDLKCPPTKKGFAAAGKKKFRIAAKNVLFGIFYGRSAKAIALQCKEEGNPIDVEEAEKIIETIFNLYPGLSAFFDACRGRARAPRWMSNSFGRFRRVPPASDSEAQGELERQMMNFPIQSFVASTVDRALAMMQRYRDAELTPDYFRLLLQQHDAVLLEAPYETAQDVAERILPRFMCEEIPLFPTNLDGYPVGTGPYYFGIDVEMFESWGQKLSSARKAAIFELTPGN